MRHRSRNEPRGRRPEGEIAQVIGLYDDLGRRAHQRHVGWLRGQHLADQGVVGHLEHDRRRPGLEAERPQESVVRADQGRLGRFRLVGRVVGQRGQLSATFISLGAAQVVASVLPVLDAQTAPLMAALHRRMAAGEPAFEALAATQRETVGDERMMAIAGGFVCLGAGGPARPQARALP